jgi:polyisoprenoid-binding protein YceI
MSEAVTPIQLERYAIDARGSRLTIQAFATGMLSVMGHNPVIAARDLSGEIRFAPDTFDSVSLTLRIATASLTVQSDVSDKDRRDMEQTMKEQVLETAKYPEIVIEGSKVSIEKTSDGRLRADVECNVTMHGITRTQRVPGQVFMLGDTLRAQGEFQVRQTDFGITPVSVAGGALKIKDELKCSFDLLARKAT